MIKTAVIRIFMPVMLALLLLCLAVSEGYAAQVWEKPTRGAVGIKGGILSGTETRGDLRLRTSWDKSLEVFFEFPIVKRTAIQFAFDFHNFHVNRVDNWMIDVNLALKPTFRLKRANVNVKPGAAVGYGYVGIFTSYFEATRYLTVRGFVEADFIIDPKKAWLIEFSTLFTPTGGNDEYDLRVGPVFMLRFGLSLR